MKERQEEIERMKREIAYLKDMVDTQKQHIEYLKDNAKPWNYMPGVYKAFPSAWDDELAIRTKTGK